MYMTEHAKQRWEERFSNICPYYEYNLAQKPKKSQLADIAKQCKTHTSLSKMGEHTGTYYKITPHNIVFVCTKEDVVVTVFPYTNRQVGVTRVHTHKVYRKGQLTNSKKRKHNW